ncbi:hypothetical protein PA598K_00916 [Paenibacillus sp. 598K]|uniref:stage III sporulation protein AF n=1 Tax=Paenibacillus sp. 598K TaxID=1117987 RepID=UPI000FF95F5B|nr:stage III sporulation protein AF [Paenibacillus sp. 598K]GBF72653.1 hypothetical protein PA598K_00916 [Paenibacillus sp. 598K]
MMAWLVEWLRQIIAIVLLAGIVELLLPSNAYQRYVRLVLGLFILLALLSPILTLLQGELGTRLEASIRDWQSTANRQLADGSESLAEVQRQADGLRERQQEQVAQLAAAKVGAEMAEEIARRSGIPAPEVAVTLAAERDGYWRIETVRVTLVARSSDRASTDSGKSGSGEPIEPIAIDVWLGESVSTPVGTPLLSEEQTSREAAPRWQTAIRTILQDGWGVAAERVEVLQADGE